MWKLIAWWAIAKMNGVIAAITSWKWTFDETLKSIYGIRPFTFSRPSTAYNPDTGAEIPADTPIYVDFAAGRKGSLMVEGTENLLAAEQSLSFDVWSKLTGVTVEEGVAVSPTGSMDADRINGLGEESGDRITAVCLPEQSVSGRTFVFSVWLKGEGENVGKEVRVDIKRNSGTLVEARTVVTLTDEWIRCVTPPITGLEDNIGIRVALRRSSGDYASSCLAWRPQVEEKSYPTPWHIGGGTRANPLKRITLPEALPEEFGVGIAFKPLWGINDPASEGVYRTLFDIRATANTRIALVWSHVSKIWRIEARFDGVEERASLPVMEFSAGDIIAIYFERRASRFWLAGKIAGGGTVFSDWVADDRQLPNFTEIYVGSRYDGAASANAVFADFVLHNRAEDIDPIRFLSSYE